MPTYRCGQCGWGFALLVAASLMGCSQDPPPVKREAAPVARVEPGDGPPRPTVRTVRPTTRPTTRSLANLERERGTQTLAYPTGDPANSVILLEKSFPMQARLGQTYRYELKVTNLTDAALSNVVVRERFPDSFRAAPAASAPATTSTPATQPAVPPMPEPVQAEPGTALDNVREYFVGELGPGQSRTIPVSGVADRLGKLDTRTSVSYTPLLVAGTDVINPILRLTKTAPSDADFCEPVPFTYTVSNIGVGTETEVRIEEKLPEGLVTQDGQSTVKIDVGDLPENQAREFTVKLKALKTGPVTSRAMARGTGTEAQSGEVTTTVRAPKLTVAVTGPANEYVGKAASYDLVVTNIGDAPARSTAVEASADNGARMTFFAGISPEPGRHGNGEDASSQSLGTIPPGESRKARVAFTPTQGGVVNVSVRARAHCADAVTASASTTVQTIAALLLDLTDRDDLVRLGEQTVYTITVKNQGSGADKNVRVVATIPKQMEFVRAGGPTEGKRNGEKVTFAPLPTLAPGESVTWTIDVLAVQASDVRFRVELTSDTLTEPALETEPTRLY